MALTAAAACMLTGNVSGIGSGPTSTDTQLDYMSTGSVVTGIFSSVAFPFKPGMAIRWAEIEAGAAKLAPEDCDGVAACRIRLNLLNDTTNAVHDQPLLGKITAVNKAINRLIDYRSDKDIYGVLDYWATPKEILGSGRGDCEDFAILKMAALRAAGLPADSMALVVLRDSSRNFYHAVLAVSTSSNTYVLDNLRDTVLTDKQLPQYQALYSLSMQKAWVHGYKRGSEFAMQKRPKSLEAVQPGEGIRDPS
jgi:predicted transglutaminase-like cysteine proteinase